MGVCRRSRTLSLDRLPKFNSQNDGGEELSALLLVPGTWARFSLAKVLGFSLAMVTVSSYNDIWTHTRSST
jgi:hypothetical protein